MSEDGQHQFDCAEWGAFFVMNLVLILLTAFGIYSIYNGIRLIMLYPGGLEKMAALILNIGAFIAVYLAGRAMSRKELMAIQEQLEHLTDRVTKLEFHENDYPIERPL